MSGTDYTLTTNLGLYKPLPSADINQWGSHLNLNADTIDSALYSVQNAGPFLRLSGGTVSGPTTHINQTSGPTLILSGDATQITNANPTGWMSIGGFVGGTPSSITQLVGLTIQDVMHSSVVQQGVNIIHNLAPNGNSGSGNRITFSVNQTTVGTSQGGSFNQTGINQAGQFTLFAQSNVGGTAATPQGAQSALSVSSTLYPTATHFSGNAVMELNIANQTGSSVQDENCMLFVHTGDHQVQASRESNILYFADQIGVGAQWKSALTFGGATSQWPLDPVNGAVLQARICNNYSTVAAGARFGLDMLQAGFPAFNTTRRGGFLSSNGFGVDGLGAVQIGTGYISPSTAGISIDCNGVVGTGATVAAGGSGYVANDILFDPWGGIYRVTAVSVGAVTGIAVFTDGNGNSRWPHYPAATAPANPVATTAWTFSAGSGCTLTLTWNTTATTLSLNPTGQQILTNLSAAATDAAAATAGVPIGGLYNNAGVVHVRLT